LLNNYQDYQSALPKSEVIDPAKGQCPSFIHFNLVVDFPAPLVRFYKTAFCQDLNMFGNGGPCAIKMVSDCTGCNSLPSKQGQD
jgi:hypothetical protein